MEIRKIQADAMRRRAQSLREASCGFSSGVSRALLELADAIDSDAALLEAKAAKEGEGKGGKTLPTDDAAQ